MVQSRQSQVLEGQDQMTSDLVEVMACHRPGSGINMSYSRQYEMFSQVYGISDQVTLHCLTMVILHSV